VSLSAGKPGSSPVNLGWSARLRIARGVARGLAFLHDKKWVHGNVKPSNVLLDADMEPLLADLGIDRLVRSGRADGNHRPATSAWFGNKRSAKSLPDLSPPPGPGAPSASPLAGGAPSETATHYRAPEAAAASRSTKPSAKWDVYSFGVLLLELVAGRALTSLELCQCGAAAEKAQALRVTDPALREEMEGREEAVASCLRLGAACCAVAPSKRPSMRDALQAIERIPALASAATASSTTSAVAGAR
jgi:serine/threonine protein kinase